MTLLRRACSFIEVTLDFADPVFPFLKELLGFGILSKKRFGKLKVQKYQKYSKNKVLTKIAEFEINFEPDFELDEPEIGRGKYKPGNSLGKSENLLFILFCFLKSIINF